MTAQTSLFSTSANQSEKALSVSELNQGIKSRLESDYGYVVLKGEISNFTAHSSGHFYFSLKDAKSQISAVMFRGQNARLNFRPKNGLEVVVKGKVTVYSPRGSYQVLCERMQPVGQGGLKEEFEKLKLKLKSEGLFELDQKKTLPYLPFHIALVTSPTGAAVQDMINVLSRRHPSARVTVVPTLTQGERAAPALIEALSLAEKELEPEVIILARGGGSLEDMWCFNDESLARKIFSMKTPVVSGVGHEIDFTIADFVSDYRAPTPSAAAEIVCRNVDEIKERIHQLQKRMLYKIQAVFSSCRQKVDLTQKRLVDPRRRLVDFRYRLDELAQRAERQLQNKFSQKKEVWRRLYKNLFFVEKKIEPFKERTQSLKKALVTASQNKKHRSKMKFEVLSSRLNALSPYAVLERGYSIVSMDETSEIVKEADQIKGEEILSVKVKKGSFKVKALKP